MRLRLCVCVFASLRSCVCVSASGDLLIPTHPFRASYCLEKNESFTRAICRDWGHEAQSRHEGNWTLRRHNLSMTKKRQLQQNILLISPFSTALFFLPKKNIVHEYTFFIQIQRPFISVDENMKGDNNYRLAAIASRQMKYPTKFVRKHRHSVFLAKLTSLSTGYFLQPSFSLSHPHPATITPSHSLTFPALIHHGIPQRAN